MNKQMAESKTAVAEQAQAVNATAETQAARATVDLTNIRMPDRKHSIVGGKCLQFECGEANASVDLYTGRLLLTLPLFRNQDTLPVSLIYNSLYYDAVQKGNRIGLGMGLSIQGGLIYYNDERAFIDGAGIAEYFDYALPREANGTSAYEDTAKTRKFKIYEKTGDLASKTGKQVSNGTKLTFPNSEYLYTDGVSESYIGTYHKMCGADDMLTELEYEYSDGSVLEKQLLKVKNGSTTIISLTYNGTKLVNSITKGTETVNFGYSNGYLKTVQRVDGGVSTILLNCTYDTSGNLIQAESLGNILRFTHSGGKVTSVEERSRYIKVGATTVTNDLIGNKWEIYRVNDSRTRVTDKNKLATDYFFGEGGKLIAELVAPESSLESYAITRGNMDFSQVERFSGEVTIGGDSKTVMRERIHSCQAPIRESDKFISVAGGYKYVGANKLCEHTASGSNVYIFTGWFRAQTFAEEYEKFTDGEEPSSAVKAMFGIRAQWYSEKAGKNKSLYVPLQPINEDWQFIAVPFRCLDDKSANVSWYLDLSRNSTARVNVADAAIYKTQGNWRVSLDQDYSITYGNKNNEVSLFNINGFTAKKILRENFTDTVLKTYTTEYTAISEYRLLNDTDYSGVKTTYSYDSRGRVTGKTMSKSGITTSSSVTYDGISGRLASETTAGGKVLYTYNQYGDCLTVKLPKGDGTTFTYNNRGLPETVTATKFASNTQSIHYQNGFPIKYVCGTKTYEMTYDGFGRVLEVKENGSVKKSVVYNDFGISLDGVSGATHSATVTFANGFKTATYTDKYGQLIRVNENNSSVSEFTYDASGNLEQAIDNKVNSVYTYTYLDGFLRTVKETRNGVVLLTTAYSTNADGEIDRVNFDYGLKKDEYTQTLDEFGRLDNETTPLGTMKYTYDALGRIDKRSGYGDFTEYKYLSTSTIGATNFPSRISFSDMSRYDFTYDNNGNISNIVSGDGNDNITYAYDNVGRLTSETRKNKYYNTFAYDINGNLTEKNEYPYENGAIASNKRTRRIFTYTNGQLSAYDGKSCYYDANGNPTTYLGKACTWERGRLLKKYGNTSFEYDANGLRTKKGSKEYIWSGDRLLGEKENGKVTMRYFYDASGIAGYEYSGTKFVFRKNLQGDVIGVIDSTGTLLGTYEYDAWGNCTATKVIVMGTTAVLSMNPFRYRGYYFDSETGLYYLQSRYYDPQTGRFISPDAYSYLEPETVNGLNLYSYCGNNPVMYVDPKGESFFALLLILVAGAITGGAIGGVLSSKDGKTGWDLVKDIFLGAAIGLAVSGAILAVTGVAVGAFAGTSYMILGVKASQMFAIGALAVNFTAFFIAPLYGIEMEGIEYESPESPYHPPKPNLLPVHPGSKNSYGRRRGSAKAILDYII